MPNVTAPINGKIVKINVAIGDTVKENQSLLVFEAMKMEMDLPAPTNGLIKEIKIKEGQQIDVDTILMVIE
ncbi:MAG: acetyl-CoA carboxylase biotin carboxyl carrier protein subunit [Planctomycetota bacterium]